MPLCHRYAAPLFLVTNPGLALRAAAGAIQGGTANAALFKPWPALPDGLTAFFYPVQPDLPLAAGQIDDPRCNR